MFSVVCEYKVSPNKFTSSIFLIGTFCEWMVITSFAGLGKTATDLLKRFNSSNQKNRTRKFIR